MDDKYKLREICSTLDHKWVQMRGKGQAVSFECARCGVVLTVEPEIKKA